MIFVTVGTQLPFDRLVEALDRWAGDNPAAAVFAQIGDSSLRPAHMEWTPRLSAMDFQARMRAARLVVSHAGIGILLAAIEAQKPLLIMPRREALKEIRSDHQLATAEWLRQVPGITVADDTTALAAALSAGDAMSPAAIEAPGRPALTRAVRQFIEG